MAEIENIPNWSSKLVVNWFRGLDDSLQRYCPNLEEASITGDQLLALNNEDLNNLGITLIGHQELVLEAVELLKKLHFGLDTANLQSHALDLNCRCRALRSSISSRRRNADGGTIEAFHRGSSIPLLRLAADVLNCAKHLIMWLDRPPFLNRSDIRSVRSSIVKLNYELSTTMQQTVFACVIEDAALSICKEMEVSTNQLIVSSDPMTIQPSSLEVAHLVDREPSSGLGLFIKATFEGHLVITGTKEGSISSRIRRIAAGDEVVGVSGQTVIGWQLSKLVAALKSGPSDITLTLKKRPTFTHNPASVTPSRRPRPERVLTVAPPISPIRKVMDSRKNSTCDAADSVHTEFEPTSINLIYEHGGKKKKKMMKRKNKSTVIPESKCDSSSQRSSMNSFGYSRAAMHEEHEKKASAIHRSLDNIFKSAKGALKDVNSNKMEKALQKRSKSQGQLESDSNWYDEGPVILKTVSSPLDMLLIPPPPEAPYTPRMESLMGVGDKATNSSTSSTNVPAQNASESPNSLLDIEHCRRFTVIGSEQMDEKWCELLTEIDSNKVKRSSDLSTKQILESRGAATPSEVRVFTTAKPSLQEKLCNRPRLRRSNLRRPTSMPPNYYSPIKLRQLRMVYANGSRYLNERPLNLTTIIDATPSAGRFGISPAARIDDQGVKKLAPLICSSQHGTQTSKVESCEHPGISESPVEIYSRCSDDSNNNNNKSSSSDGSSDHGTKCPPKSLPRLSVGTQRLSAGNLDSSQERTQQTKCFSARMGIGSSHLKSDRCHPIGQYLCPASDLLNDKQDVGTLRVPPNQISQQVPITGTEKYRLVKPEKVDVASELTKFCERKRSNVSGVSDTFSPPVISAPDWANDEASIKSSQTSKPKSQTFTPVAKRLTETGDMAQGSANNNSHGWMDVNIGTASDSGGPKVSVSQVQQVLPIPHERTKKEARIARLRSSPTSRGSYIAAIDVGYALKDMKESGKGGVIDKRGGFPQDSGFSDVKVVGGIHVRLRKSQRGKRRHKQDLSPDMRSQRRISCRDLGQGDCSGWLWKKKTSTNSPLSSKWTKRWIILKEGAIYCYRNEEDKKAESYIELPGYQIAPYPESKKKFAFRVVHPHRRTFFFASDRQKDMSRWMNKMGLAAIEYAFTRGKDSDEDDDDQHYYSESESDDAFMLSDNSSNQSSLGSQGKGCFGSLPSCVENTGEAKDIQKNFIRSEQNMQKCSHHADTVLLQMSDNVNVRDNNRRHSESRDIQSSTDSNDLKSNSSDVFAKLSTTRRDVINSSPDNTLKEKSVMSVDQRKYKVAEPRRMQYLEKGPLSHGLEVLNLQKSNAHELHYAKSEEELRHLKNVAAKKAGEVAKRLSSTPQTSLNYRECIEKANQESRNSTSKAEFGPDMNFSQSLHDQPNPKVTRRDAAGRPRLQVMLKADSVKGKESKKGIIGKDQSSLNELCKALQKAQVDIHGVNRKTTLRRKMTILSRDPKKNELMLKKRALQRQLKALQVELEYYDHLLEHDVLTSERLHDWINQHLSLFADLGTLRRMSKTKRKPAAASFLGVAENTTDIETSAVNAEGKDDVQSASMQSGPQFVIRQSEPHNGDTPVPAVRTSLLSNEKNEIGWSSDQTINSPRAHQEVSPKNMRIPVVQLSPKHRPRSGAYSNRLNSDISSFAPDEIPTSKSYLETDL